LACDSIPVLPSEKGNLDALSRLLRPFHHLTAVTAVRKHRAAQVWFLHPNDRLMAGLGPLA